jgi:hypothetical protein
VCRAGVDDEYLTVAQHDPDVLVEERVAPDENTIAELDPDTHVRDDIGPARRRAMDGDAVA